MIPEAQRPGGPADRKLHADGQGPITAWCGSLWRFDQPALDIACVHVECRAHQEDVLAAIQVGLEVAFLADLPDRRFGGVVQLELDHVGPVVGLYHGIGATDIGADFRRDEEADQFEDNIDDRLIVLLMAQMDISIRKETDS